MTPSELREYAIVMREFGITRFSRDYGVIIEMSPAAGPDVTHTMTIPPQAPPPELSDLDLLTWHLPPEPSAPSTEE